MKVARWTTMNIGENKIISSKKTLLFSQVISIKPFDKHDKIEASETLFL